MSTQDQQPEPMPTIPPWQGLPPEKLPEEQKAEQVGIVIPEANPLEWQPDAGSPWTVRGFWASWFATVRPRIQPAPLGSLAFDNAGNAYIRTKTGWRQIQLS